MQHRWRRAVAIGLVVLAVTGAGSFAAAKYVDAADHLNITEDLTARMADLRSALAAGDTSRAAAQPFVQVRVGAGERVASPNAAGVSILRSWADDGSIHDVIVGKSTYKVLVEGLEIDGLLATAAVGESADAGARGRSALRRSLVLIAVLAAVTAALASGALSRPQPGRPRRRDDPLRPPTIDGAS